MEREGIRSSVNEILNETMCGNESTCLSVMGDAADDVEEIRRRGTERSLARKRPATLLPVTKAVLIGKFVGNTSVASLLLQDSTV